MRQHLKNFYFNLLRLTGREARLLRQIRQGNRLVILNLHQVSPHQNPFWSPLAPEIFEDLLVFLKQHFHVALFRELETVKSNKPLAVLSFDDGYYNFIEYAAPLLAKHGLRANMNIIPSCVESGLPPWNVQLYDFLNSVPREVINQIKLPDFDAQLGDDSTGGKVRYGLQISRFLKNRPRREREELWQSIEPLMKKADFARTRMMNTAEVKEIAQTHEVGVHSFSHESMKFEDDDFFIADLDKCFDFFQHKLQMPLDIYAFPNGSYRDGQIEILQNRGLRFILLVEEKYSRVGSLHPRQTIYGASKAETRLQALGLNNRQS